MPKLKRKVVRISNPKIDSTQKCISCNKEKFSGDFYSNQNYRLKMSSSPISPFYGRSSICKDCQRSYNRNYRQKQILKECKAYWKKHLNAYQEFADLFVGFGDFQNLNCLVPTPSIPLVSFFIRENNFRRVHYLLETYVELFVEEKYLRYLPPLSSFSSTIIHLAKKEYKKYLHYFVLEKKCQNCHKIKQTFREAESIEQYLTVIPFNLDVFSSTQTVKGFHRVSPLDFSRSYTSWDGWSGWCRKCSEITE